MDNLEKKVAIDARKEEELAVKQAELEKERREFGERAARNEVKNRFFLLGATICIYLISNMYI